MIDPTFGNTLSDNRIPVIAAPADLPWAAVLVVGLAGLAAGYAIARHTGPSARHYCDVCAVFEVDECGDLCDDCLDVIGPRSPEMLERIKSAVFDEVAAQRTRRAANPRGPGAVRMSRSQP